MIRIFYGRENLNKEKFMYDQISSKGGNTLVIVPDQYTLEAEKKALEYMGKTTLMDVEITGFSRVGYHVMKELGGDRNTFVDKYGRHILLTHILKDMEGFEAFGTLATKDTFIEMVNDLISQFKQLNVTPLDLLNLKETCGEEEESLKHKLGDIAVIYQRYEEKINGKYTDSEDLLRIFAEKLKESKDMENKEFWLYGFDSFSPRNMEMIGELIAKAQKSDKDLNLVLTLGNLTDDEWDREIYLPGKRVVKQLREVAAERGLSNPEVLPIPKEYLINERAEAIKHIENSIYSSEKINKIDDSKGLTVVKSANIYNEIETAAAFVLSLLRDENYEYQDILLLCNDESHRGSIINRVFREYGMEVFKDTTRKVINEPTIRYILALIKAPLLGYSTNVMISAMKTGISTLTKDEAEELENYVYRFKIMGSMWTKAFKYGGDLGQEGVDLEAIEALRIKFMEPFIEIAKLLKKSKEEGWTYRQLMGGFFHSLVKLDIDIKDKNLWEGFLGIIDQIVELIGEEEANPEEFLNLLVAGLSQLKIGILPPTKNELILGTMQRSRVADVKALVVIGANEGLIPVEKPAAGIFSQDEINRLAEDRRLETLGVLMNQEEKLAIYRNLSKPSNYLWIGYSVGDDKGEKLLPSEIVENLKEMFSSDIEVEDILSRDNPVELINGSRAAIRHLTEALLKYREGEEVYEGWKVFVDWLEEHQGEFLKKLEKSLNFKNTPINLDREVLEKLYGFSKNVKPRLTPYKLEALSKCPFQYFFDYGLRPKERRVFQVDSRILGDVYHLALEKFSRKMDAEKAWTEAENYSDEQLLNILNDILEEIISHYGDRILSKGSLEHYMVTRLRKLSLEAFKALILQHSLCKIRESKYEVAFREGEPREPGEYVIPPIEVELDQETVLIQGKIDRVDFLEDDGLTVIDYKTGATSYDKKLVEAGFSLQLFVYLRAAAENRNPKGEGVFYIKLADQKVRLDDRVPVGEVADEEAKEGLIEEVKGKKQKHFGLDGVARDTLISCINQQVLAKSSRIFLSENDFTAFKSGVNLAIERACEKLLEGDISISPMKVKDITPCQYCRGKDVCCFDVSKEGFNYRRGDRG